MSAQKSDYRWAPLIGYNYNKSHFAELGLVKGYRCNYKYENGCEMIALEIIYHYVSFSSEIRVDEDLIFGPKVGAHLVLGIPHIGFSIFNYTDFKNNMFGVRPEIGMSFFGSLSACYGFNLNISKRQFNISSHNLGIKAIIKSGLMNPDKMLLYKNSSDG